MSREPPSEPPSRGQTWGWDLARGRSTSYWERCGGKSHAPVSVRLKMWMHMSATTRAWRIELNLGEATSWTVVVRQVGCIPCADIDSNILGLIGVAATPGGVTSLGPVGILLVFANAFPNQTHEHPSDQPHGV